MMEISFYQDSIKYWITFRGSDITAKNGVLEIDPSAIKLTLSWDAFENMSDEDAQIARTQWMKNTTVLSCTLSKVSNSYIDKLTV